MQIQAKNLPDLNSLIQNNADVENAFKENPKEALQKFTDTSFIPDNWIYRIVVGSLGFVIVVITLGIVWRVASGNTVEDKNIPTILTALGSAAIGALAGLLAPSPSRG
jgi:cytochrome bd-type quinol oxidase subunit 1